VSVGTILSWVGEEDEKTSSSPWLYIRACTRLELVVAWNLSLNSHLFDAAIWGRFVTLFRKRKEHT
jgi:hypothetical protein